MTFSQQTGNSTQTQTDKREQVVSALERAQAEVKASRVLIKDYEGREKALVHQVEILGKNTELLTENYFKAVSELAELRASLKSEREAFAAREAQVEQLRTERDDLKKKLKAARRRELLMTAGIAAITLLKILF